MAEEAIRIRVYGLLRMTRGGYLILQGVLMALLVALIFWWLLAGMPQRFAGQWFPQNLHWLFVAGLVFEAFETYFVLSAFHHKQRIAERAKRR